MYYNIIKTKLKNCKIKGKKKKKNVRKKRLKILKKFEGP